MQQQGEKIYISAKNVVRKLNGGKRVRGVLSDYLGVVEENFNGHINILSGVHGVLVKKIQQLD